MVTSSSRAAGHDFHAIFEATPTPYLILTPAFVIAAVNDAYLQATRRMREEIVGRHVFDAFPDNPEASSAQAVLNLRTSLERVVTHRTRDTMALQRYDILIGNPADGRFEERYWSPINTPVFDSNGDITYIIHRVEDVTDRVKAEQELDAVSSRQSFQLALADRIRPITDLDEVIAVASELLGRKLDVARVMYAEADTPGENIVIRRDWTNGSVGSMAGSALQLNDFGPVMADALRAGEILIVADVARDERTASYAAAYAANGVQSFLTIPLMTDGQLRAVLTVHDSRAHSWTDNEVAMAVDMVDRTRTTLENARARAELRHERNQSRHIFDSMTEGFALLNQEWIILQVNTEALRTTQQTAAEVIGRNHWDVWPELIGTDTEKLYRRVKATGVAGTLEMSHVLPDGNGITVEIRAYPALGGGLAVFFRDITQSRQAQEKLRHASLHDSLTGLPNRAMLFEYAGHLLPHNRRTNSCAAVLFLDLDRFKPVNDTHGHETGDEVLKEVATRLSRSLRAEDIVVRLGGDEFLILLQDIKHASQAAEVAGHIVAKISEPYQTGDLTLSLSTSIGISIFPRDGQDIDTLISHADVAMYQAKQAGRNNFQFFSPEFAAGNRLQLVIEQQLRSALRKQAFRLCYQPVVDLGTGAIVSVEALLRWDNDDVGPDRFVPVAEATGVINPIGRWVLHEASRQHKAWIANGLPAIPIAVNVSAVEFRDRDFVTRYRRLVEEHGIDMNALQLELTETAVMDDIEHAITMLAQLQAMGVTILLDDFGTGHSSMAYLARLPLNKMKIDKSFISRLETDVASRAVTEAMLALGRTLNLDVIAEGVESNNVLAYVEEHGCQQAQGYFFSKPMTGEAFESWYRESRPDLRRTNHRTKQADWRR